MRNGVCFVRSKGSAMEKDKFEFPIAKTESDLPPPQMECKECGMPIEKYRPVNGVCGECKELDSRSES